MGMTCVLTRVPADLVGLLRADPAVADRLLFHDDGSGSIGEVLDLDKMWEPVHVVMGGAPMSTGAPQTGTLFDGEPVGHDTGYGHPRLHDPASTAHLAAATGGLTEAWMRERFDVRRMTAADVYPQIWDEDPSELEDEVVGAALDVIALVRRAAEAGDGLVVAIC